jgi:predicted nucleic acid-binding protein
VLIVSEFINAYARIKWQLVAPHVTPFKVFRKSEEFKAIAQDIAADVRRVLSHRPRVENGFETLKIEGLMTEYAAGEYGFNDQILVELCQRKGFKLVTDDGDFAGQEISIVKANKRLLV